MKLLSRIAFLFVLLIAANSCQRDTKDTTSPKVPADLAKQIQQGGRSVYVPLNVSMAGTLTNSKGVEIQHTKNAIGARTPDAICEDPTTAEVGPNTLTGIDHTLYDCTALKHSLTVHITIRSSFDLSNTNPNNTAQISKGRVRIKNGSTITYQDLAIPLSTLTYTGDDPNEAGIKLYNLTFTESNIAHQYLSPGSFTSVEASAVVYTDCAAPYDTYFITTAYATAFVPGLALDPCNRVDPVYISTSSTPPMNTDCGSIAGSYVVSSPGACQNFTVNTASQVQVKKAGDPDANYVNIRTRVVGVPGYTTDGYVYYYEVRYIEQVQDYVPNTTAASLPGQFTFRWRNVNITGSTTCFGPWSTPVNFTINDY
jgi:hypothetical protein